MWLQYIKKGVKSCFKSANQQIYDGVMQIHCVNKW